MKLSQLKSEGWYDDTSHHMDSSVDNLGLLERSNIFRVDFSSEKPYRANGATFMGRIMHDLVSCESGCSTNGHFL